MAQSIAAARKGGVLPTLRLFVVCVLTALGVALLLTSANESNSKEASSPRRIHSETDTPQLSDSLEKTSDRAGLIADIVPSENTGTPDPVVSAGSDESTASVWQQVARAPVIAFEDLSEQERELAHSNAGFFMRLKDGGFAQLMLRVQEPPSPELANIAQDLFLCLVDKRDLTRDFLRNQADNGEQLLTVADLAELRDREDLRGKDIRYLACAEGVAVIDISPLKTSEEYLELKSEAEILKGMLGRIGHAFSAGPGAW